MTRLQGGVFDVPIKIEQRQTVRKDDWTGEQVFADWPLFRKVWARRQVLRGTELFQAQQFNSKVSVIFKLRHPVDGVRHDMRINDSEKIYDITSIVEAERDGGGQELHCTRHAD